MAFLSHKINAALLVMLMLSSSLGVAMDVHFCEGEFESINLFGKANVCEKALTQKEKSSHACCSKKGINKVSLKVKHKIEAKGNCCQNKTFSFDTDNIAKNNYVKVGFEQPAIINSSFVYQQVSFLGFKS